MEELQLHSAVVATRSAWGNGPAADLHGHCRARCEASSCTQRVAGCYWQVLETKIAGGGAGEGESQQVQYHRRASCGEESSAEEGGDDGAASPYKWRHPRPPNRMQPAVVVYTSGPAGEGACGGDDQQPDDDGMGGDRLMAAPSSESSLPPVASAFAAARPGLVRSPAKSRCNHAASLLAVVMSICCCAIFRPIAFR